MNSAIKSVLNSKTGSILLGILLFLTAFNAFARKKTPDLTGRVVNQTSQISSSECAKIEDHLVQFEKATHCQMAVLLIDSLEGDSLEEFSICVAEKWRIGYKGKDNGLILLVAFKEKKIRMEVGYGLEGSINDARAGDIIRGMKPFFKEGKFTDGIIYAIGQSQQFITGCLPDGTPLVKNSGALPLRVSRMIVFFIILIMILTGIFLHLQNIVWICRGTYGSRGRGLHGGLGGGGFYGGGGAFGSGGGGGGGGGFSGGGGSFGGGGASGGW